MRTAQIGQCLLFALLIAVSSAAVKAENLPARETPIPRTTEGVPHVQIGVEPVPEISAELLRRVSEIPGVEIQDSILSLPGALGFWVTEDTPLARPEVILRGREFAHLHPDGSLHASLPPALADQAVATGWAVPHPWADQRPGWDGFVMIFTPASFDEMEIVLGLVQESYQFVTGDEASSN